MKRDLALLGIIIVVSLLLVMSASMAGARYLRSAAWAGDINQPVMFVQSDRLSLD